MRHAKSDWQNPATSDFDRPLNKRGRRAAKEVGVVLKSLVVPPDRVVCSPALRARQTIERVFPQTGWRLDRLQFDQDLYLAPLARLIEIGEKHAATNDSLMLVGHNPGLEDFLKYLCGSDIERTGNGKLFTTANVAIVELGSNGVSRGCQGRLLQLHRPG